MLRQVTILLIAVGLTVPALAGPKPGKPGEKPKVKVPAEKDPMRMDYVGKYLYEYNLAAERDAFFRAAGVDGELDQKEFYASREAHRLQIQGKDPGKAVFFVRTFEHWSSGKALKSDADGSGRLNWPEIIKYREGIRNQLLARHDRDRNGKLFGPERENANDQLRRDVRVPGRRWRPWRIARWDEDDDGKLDIDEQRDHDVWLKKQAEKKQAHDDLVQWDLNKDGKLDADEKAARDAEIKRRAEEQAARLKKWDRNGDGALDEEETYLADQCNVSDPRRTRRLMGRFDRDRDGKITGKEENEMIAHYTREYAQHKRKQMLRRWDKNHDGRLDSRERAVMKYELKKAKEAGKTPGQ